MAVQNVLNVNNQSPFLSGSFKSDGGTLAQDAGETIPTARMTVLGQVSASLKLVPLVSTATDRRQFPFAILNQEAIPAADVVAGDVELTNIVKGGDGKINKASIVFHNGTDTLDTIVSGRTIESYLNDKGLFFKDVVDIVGYENA